MNTEFWEFLQKMVDSSEIVIDRAKGSVHQRYPAGTYPVSYGYLKGTNAMDGGGVDIWAGSLDERRVVGALCTVDLMKRDTELKIIYDCTETEIESIIDYINIGQMRAIYISRE